ncbi:NAD(P)-dependent oxidoreductase [Pokkaliibacter sp. MBI-7]|uniref:NAD(P)-dependent oxidoreductase n=1 Tax=Pokkaliibacter sp. MBI-7 TaxID=3040600 RepID=UPI00244C4E63|nr:NAD(P)-dependent oxidoreductase [Pokkaliibacter sp. MBI-7]MDH2433380.1 NAD(P)-dependent oxidoreductase [Pokkaliibacter sp. MBI-7]
MKRKHSMNIAFIGLGSMGKPMASNLLAAGQSLQVWNRNPLPAEALATLGARVCTTPRQAAAGADVVITMLADDNATRAVLFDAGVLEAMTPGSVHVNMATISVALADELAGVHQARGLGYVAAPVLGRVDVAAAGKLNILAAGAAERVARIQPLLDIMGQKTWYYGEQPSQANAVKLAVNFCIGSAIETMAEGAALSRAHGVAAADFIELITTTLFAAPAYVGYGKLIAEEKYEFSGFKLALGLKDIRLALAAGESKNVPLPFASSMRDSLLEAVAHGDGDKEWAAMAKVAARRAGLE